MFDPVWSPEWVWLRYATFLRATLFLGVIAVSAVLLRRAPASVRAGLWAAALLALLPLPELRALPVAWSAHVVPPLLAWPMVAIGTTMVAQSSTAASAFPWTSWVAVGWATGVLVVIGGLLRGHLALAALAARARPVECAAWQALLQETRGALAISRPVRLLRSDGTVVPLTWGTWRPAVLLPAGADDWSDVQRRAVLLHELAHVRRLDCLLAVVAHLACALWWFHPGAWWAARRLRIERERACDARVLLAGVRRSDYAECLLQISDAARGLRQSWVVACTPGLFRRGDLRGRLRTILNPGPTPLRRARRGVEAGAVAAAVCAALLVGSMRISPRPDVFWTALASAEWTTRAYAAENIARFGGPGALAALDAALRDEPHPSVSVLAAFGGRLRARSAAPGVRFGWREPPVAPQVPSITGS
jgi:beta-lactamase regulating signal transducer with metallopeptidase domain